MSFIASPPLLLENSTLFGNCCWGELPLQDIMLKTLEQNKAVETYLITEDLVVL
ncbi:MAG: hypothetical protein ACRCRR_02585 [Rickettsia sp.]